MSELTHGVADRRVTLRFQLLSGCFITISSIYAPTLARSEADIDMFYTELREILKRIHKKSEKTKREQNSREGKGTSFYNLFQ